MSRHILEKFIDVWDVIDTASTGPETVHARSSAIQTDEERVVELLSARDGYTWQGDVVTTLEWSDAKTSRVLSAMEEDGRITRHQIGRRKAVCLPHREPAVLTEGVEATVGR